MNQTHKFVTDSPDYSRDLYPTVFRSVAFVDVAGFTAYTTDHGTHAGAQMLNVFRHIVRTHAGMHGVRVAKWLGDGVMMIGVTEQPLIDCLGALYHACAKRGINIHAGVTSGDVLIFEGDDYIGKIVNMASRIADRAELGQILAYGISPEVVASVGDNLPTIRLQLKGIGTIDDVVEITPKS